MNLLLAGSNEPLDTILTILILVGFVLFLVGYKVLEKRRLSKPTSEEVETGDSVAVTAPIVRQQIKLEDIKDEDMMVAALIATAEFVEETKEKDARLVSIKQIG